MDETRPMSRAFGPYLCDRLLGAYPSGAVYSAHHRETGRHVALRIIPAKTEKLQQVVKECTVVLRIIKTLDAETAVPVEDYGFAGPILYMAMPFMQGGTLADRMEYRAATKQPVPAPGEAAALLTRMAAALDAAHARGLTHGQVSPRSILFDEQGQGYMADIGLSRVFKVLFELSTTNSFTTERYTSPEQWSGEKPTPASDQYSLACVFYHLITGRLPFDAHTVFGLMQAHREGVPEPPHELRPELPGVLTVPFLRAMAKNPDRRYPTVGAFAQAFAEAVADQPGIADDFFTFKLPG